MDFKDVIRQLGERVIKLKENIQTEEATKNAFIMPFLQSLGYDVFNPLEVVPEYVTDIGTKKGEKIDYAILKENQPIILVECKHWAQNLNLHDGQLLRYFHVSKAKFGILTNGIIYRFYSDLVEQNKMDEKPFFEFDISDLKEVQIEELKKFHKHYFEVDKILNTANELKYINEIKSILSNELKNPSDVFVKHFISQVYPGRATEKILLQFTEYVRKSSTQLINEMITERLKSALNKESETEQQPNSSTQDVTKAEIQEERKIDTTVEEMEAYFIIKAILRDKVSTNRVAYRDAMSHFTILLDDSNRKPLCRLYLNGAKKSISTFDSEKKENKVEINTLDDIYKFAQLILASVDMYEKAQSNS